jgi:hypothetical protein
MAEPRASTHNHGVFVDSAMPADRHIVAGFVVLMDDAGNFGAYVAQQPASFGWPTAPMPSPEILLEITNLLAHAWGVASLTTLEGTSE